jgi:hypothetical protein
LQDHTFPTDSSILASAAATELHQVPWEIRRHIDIDEYKKITSPSTSGIYHIKRDINGVAHNCAHQALRQPSSQPIFSHRNSVSPILSAVCQINIPGLVIHVVNCL